jgi:hypothetical protein
MASKSYSMKLEADKAQTAIWDFDIAQEELQTSRGIKTGIFAVIRQDNGAMIGQYSNEKALPYKSIIQTFETGLSHIHSAFKRTNIFTTGNGSRLFADYSVGVTTINGESFECFVRVFSSHDGSQKVGFQFFIKRLACLNGMMLTSEVFSIFKRHSMNLDLSFLENNIQKAIEAGTAHVQESIKAMLAIPVTDELEKRICSNLVSLGKTKGVTERAGYFINYNWMKPSRDEDSLGNNLYRLYNAATRWTRDVENKSRFEMSNKANQFISGAFDLAARRSSDLEKLFAVPTEPLDFDGVTINI